MRPFAIATVVGLVVAAAGVGIWLSRTPEPTVERRTDSGAASPETPAMCPWRDPRGDLARFFPGATAYKQEALILSAHRLEVLRRLGPGATLESNALYIYRVGSRGAVLVRRTGGEFGAIEAVVAVNTAGRILGVRVQRHREPPPTESLLRSPAFLGRFTGKGPGDPLPDDNLPLARAVRALLIEYDVAEAHRNRR